MTKIIIALIVVVILVILGYLSEAFKRLLKVITEVILWVLNLLGIKTHTKTLKVSKEFKETYKDIHIVKMRKNKQLTCIHWVYFSVLLISLLLIFLNLQVITNNAISNFIYNIIKPLGIVKSSADMNVFYTAILFSIMSFSLSKVLDRWKLTKPQRTDAKNIKIKEKAKELMSTKELLTSAREKDENKLKELTNGKSQ